MFITHPSSIQQRKVLMIPLNMTYLSGSLLFLVLWLIIFFKRKDLRLIMLVLAIPAIPFGLYTEYFWYTRDWWSPILITNTRVGIEDILYSIAHAGLPATLYLFVTGKCLSSTTVGYKSVATKICILATGVIVVGSAGLYALGLSSFVTTALVGLSIGCWIFSRRSDLFTLSIGSGLLMVCIACVVFTILHVLRPDWIDRFWLNHNLSGIRLFFAPIEDLIWYFAVGVSIGPLVPYLTEQKVSR